MIVNSQARKSAPVSALVLLYPRLPTTRIVGSDFAHAVPLTLLAGMGHLLLFTINFSVVGALLLGSLPGIFVGSWLALRAPMRFCGSPCRACWSSSVAD